jgi:hypothetical protein
MSPRAALPIRRIRRGAALPPPLLRPGIDKHTLFRHPSGLYASLTARIPADRKSPEPAVDAGAPRPAQYSGLPSDHRARSLRKTAAKLALYSNSGMHDWPY